jgi:hypothetical protein
MKALASPDPGKRKRSGSMTMDHLLKSAISLKVVVFNYVHSIY